MQTYEVIQRIRIRLNDVSQNPKFSDTELLEYLNAAQNEILFIFNLNIRTLEFDAVQTFSLKDPLLAVIGIQLNEQNIPLKPPTHITKQGADIFVFQKNPTTYSFSKKVQGIVRFTGNFAKHSLQMQDEMLLNILFLDALTYGVMIRALQVSSNEANLQRIALYQKMYEYEIKGLKQKITAQTQTKNTITPHIKV